MLKPLRNNTLVRETDRLCYADGSMALTVWLDEEGCLVAFELVFDLTIDEYAVRRLGDKPGRYLRVSEGEDRPGRHEKQTYDLAYPTLPRSRIDDFDARSANLPLNLRTHVRETLVQLLAPGDETKVDG